MILDVDVDADDDDGQEGSLSSSSSIQINVRTRTTGPLVSKLEANQDTLDAVLQGERKKNTRLFFSKLKLV